MCDSDSKLFYVSSVHISLIHFVLTFLFFFPPFIFPRSRYAQRLQSNLTWLAAAADHGKQGVSSFLFSIDLKGSLWAGHALTTRFTVFSNLPLPFFFGLSFSSFVFVFLLFFDGVCVVLVCLSDF